VAHGYSHLLDGVALGALGLENLGALLSRHGRVRRSTAHVPERPHKERTVRTGQLTSPQCRYPRCKPAPPGARDSPPLAGFTALGVAEYACELAHRAPRYAHVRPPCKGSGHLESLWPSLRGRGGPMHPGHSHSSHPVPWTPLANPPHYATQS
jgi:hypothetical protein